MLFLKFYIPLCVYYKERNRQMAIEHNNFLYNINTATCFDLASSSSGYRQKIIKRIYK